MAGGWQWGMDLADDGEIPMLGVTVKLREEPRWPSQHAATAARTREAHRRGGAPWTRAAIDRLLAELRAGGFQGQLVVADKGGFVFIKQTLP